MSNLSLTSGKSVLVHGGLTRESFVGALLRLPLRALDTLLLWQERASQRSHLASLSEHHLKDMGMSRAEADREFSKPFWRK